jgi:hypothetical protein
VLLLGAIATAVGLAVGIPAGLAAAPDRGPHVLPTATPTVIPPTSSEPGPTVDVPPVTTSATDPDPAPETAEPPSSLSAPQRRLWQKMEMDGLFAADCVGYPLGEQEFAGVEAALECPVEDPTMEQPAYLYQFDGASNLDAYMNQRAQPVSGDGRCADGEETDGAWETEDGQEIGRLVCVDNPKDGTVYFKIAFSSDADAAAVVVQDESASDAFAWWEKHAAGQFYGVGDN